MTATYQSGSPGVIHQLPLLEIRRLSLRSNQLPILQTLTSFRKWKIIKTKT
jgi:hypothetical protein